MQGNICYKGGGMIVLCEKTCLLSLLWLISSKNPIIYEANRDSSDDPGAGSHIYMDEQG